MMTETEKLIEIYNHLEDAGLMVTAGKKDTAELMVSHDVVPVVRCKDCTSYCSFEISKMYGKMQYCSLTGLPTDPCDFCSYGERRKNA